MYRYFFICLAVFYFMPSSCLAQDDFCEAVTAIYRDAPFGFRDVRTYVVETGPGMEIHRSGVPVPGVLNSRFVNSGGRFFEAAVYQTDSIAKLAPQYEKYKSQLQACAEKLGMHMKAYDNFYPGLADFKKVVFLPEYDKKTDLKKLPGHITLEVDYNKLSRLYTVVFYIFEH